MTTTSLLRAPSTSDPAATCVPPSPGYPPHPAVSEVVTVYLLCSTTVDRGVFAPDQLRAVQRVAAKDGGPLQEAVAQLLLGETPEEKAAGLQSSFWAYTAGQLRTASVENGVAILDFHPAFASVPNFSTAAASPYVWGQLEATVFHFPEIVGLELRIDGLRWCGWENTCQGLPVPLVTRP